MLNRRVNVPLRPEEIDGLLTLSQREERDPRRQAARLLREGLVRAGVLTTDVRQAPAPAGPGEAA